MPTLIGEYLPVLDSYPPNSSTMRNQYVFPGKFKPISEVQYALNTQSAEARRRCRMSSHARLLSVDLGNGFSKVRSSTKRVSFPSVISVEDETTRGFDALGLSSNHDFIIEYQGKRWAIGETVYTHGLMPVTIAHRSRIATEFYKVLFAAALAVGVHQSAEVQAIVSLPPAAYWDKDKQKAVISGEYQVKFAGRTMSYRVPRDQLRVVPEGFGAAALFCLDSQGNVRESSLFEREVGIVDVGTYTTDFVQLSKMKLVRSGTDSIPHALADMHAKLRTFVSTQGVDLDVHEADSVLRQGYFLQAGQRVSITEQTVVWISELTQVVSARLRTLWSGGDAVETIIVTGGGAPYVAPLLAQEFEHATALDATEVKVQSWESNAEGAYRYALFLSALLDGE
jgi:hypothetical protein